MVHWNDDQYMKQLKDKDGAENIKYKNKCHQRDYEVLQEQLSLIHI